MTILYVIMRLLNYSFSEIHFLQDLEQRTLYKTEDNWIALKKY